MKKVKPKKFKLPKGIKYAKEDLYFGLSDIDEDSLYRNVDVPVEWDGTLRLDGKTPKRPRDN